jgi:predicted Zn finger-like uncharacterized protein
MNYITSCPACETQFLLTTEHLKAHRGKVQCGNCEHIFNAKNRLTAISDDITSTAEYQASIEAQSHTATEPSNETPIGDVLNIVLDSVPDLEDLNTAESNQAASNQIRPSNNAGSNYTSQHIPVVIDAEEANQIQEPITINDLTADPKFQASKPKTKVWPVLLCLLLAILAGLQTIYALRTKIAAEYPQFEPYLQQTCAALQCEIALPKNLDLVTIDDSDMQEDENHQNVIKFTSLLINNASYTQAYPNIELTLTDTADQPVLRKTIQAAEYLTANANVPAGIASREEVRINLAINVKDLEVAGYRVLLVY